MGRTGFKEARPGCHRGPMLCICQLEKQFWSKHPTYSFTVQHTDYVAGLCRALRPTILVAVGLQPERALECSGDGTGRGRGCRDRGERNSWVEFSERQGDSGRGTEILVSDRRQISKLQRDLNNNNHQRTSYL